MGKNVLVVLAALLSGIATFAAAMQGIDIESKWVWSHERRWTLCGVYLLLFAQHSQQYWLPFFNYSKIISYEKEVILCQTLIPVRTAESILFMRLQPADAVETVVLQWCVLQMEVQAERADIAISVTVIRCFMENADPAEQRKVLHKWEVIV